MSAELAVIDVTPSLAQREAAPLDQRSVPMPIVTTQEARAQMIAYTALVDAVLDQSDYQEFKERGQVKRFKKKSAVKKLQTFFGISVELVGDAIKDDLGDGHFGFRVKARATAPNGRPVEALAGCSTIEERFELIPYENEDPDGPAYARRLRKANSRAYHDVLSTAETRATNRAVMNMIGAGEVTAEEMRRNEPRAESLTERAARLGIGDLRAWCIERDVVFNQAAVRDALNELEGIAAPAIASWKMTDKQRKMLMALHSAAGHNDAGRLNFYRSLTGRPEIMSSTELTRAEFDQIVKALEESKAEAKC